MIPLNVQKLLREGKVVLARPNGLTQCQAPGCRMYYRPSFAESKFCPTCIEEGAHLTERRCAYKPCGVVFKPKHSSALYHSASCRQLAYAARKSAGAAA